MDKLIQLIYSVNTHTYIVLFGIIILVRLALWGLYELPSKLRGRVIRDQYNKVAEYSVDEVLDWVHNKSDRDHYQNELNILGLFVMYNQTKNKYFVGASTHMFDHAAWQLEGHGFVSVADDIGAGDHWVVRFIPIELTENDNMEQLWYDGISAFKADEKEHGYN